MSKAVAAASLLLLLTAGWPTDAAARRQAADCRPPQLSTSSRPNIFSEEQENDLGDAIAEHIGREFRVIDDDGLTEPLARIGDRIVQHLPLTKLHFHFFLVDLPQANAFVLPGGRIYVSRKLVAFTRSEDELAAVLAHEAGHLVGRQLTAAVSRLFKDVLGVTAVGDRADVFARYNEWMDNLARRPSPGRPGGGDGDQVEADRIALYAMGAAGYDPQAYARFFDRLADTKGDTGSFLSDLVGMTSPDALRLKEIIRNTQALPSGCIDVRPANHEAAYSEWRSGVVSFTGLGRKESVRSVLWKTPLEPPLPTDVTSLRFSPNGRLIVAQDDGGVTVLTREPFKILFRIDAPGSLDAHFTPDSSGVVFHTLDLRVERWDVERRALADAYELFIRRTCLQVKLSPDGRTLACLDATASLSRYNLTLVDVATGASLLDVPEFTAPDRPTVLVLNVRGLQNLTETNWQFVHMAFSADGRYFAAAHHRDGFPGISEGEDGLVFDLQRHSDVHVKGEAKRLMASGFVFVGSNRLAAANPADARKSVVIGLPSGELMEQVYLPKGDLTAATSGPFLLERPFQDSAVGVFDLARHRTIKSLPNDAIDIYDGAFVAERGTGELGLYTMDSKLAAAVTLPRSSLSGLTAAAVSADFRWLALSERSRGSMWELTSGRSVMQTRAFDGAAFSTAGILFADFPKQGGEPRKMLRIDPMQQLAPGGPDIKDEATQVGPYEIIRRPTTKGTSMADGMEIEVRDALRPGTLWSKPFLTEPPKLWKNTRAPESLILGWSMTSKTAREEARNDPTLGRLPAVDRPLDSDYLLEVLDMATGDVRGKLVFETGLGSFDITNVVADGDVVAVSDDLNRVHVYSLKTGQSLGRVFGNRALLSASARTLVVENGPGKLAVYDTSTLQRCDDLSFSHNVAMAAFTPGGGRLFVLTSDQTAYVIDVSSRR